MAEIARTQWIRVNGRVEGLRVAAQPAVEDEVDVGLGAEMVGGEVGEEGLQDVVVEGEGADAGG